MGKPYHSGAKRRNKGDKNMRQANEAVIRERHPIPTGDDGADYIKFVAVASTPKALSSSEIERASATDQVLCAVSESLKNNVWPKGEMVEYRVISEELCFIGKILLRGTRIVMPEILRSRTLELAHEGHPGIVQMKKRLRSKVW